MARLNRKESTKKGKSSAKSTRKPKRSSKTTRHRLNSKLKKSKKAVSIESVAPGSVNSKPVLAAPDANSVAEIRERQQLNGKATVLSRKDRKLSLRKLKAAKKPHFDLSENVKIIWEKLRRKKMTLNEKIRLTDELYGFVQGRVKELIFAHDTVRVLQCLMALKNAEIRTKLFDELKNDIVELSKMKYSKFFVVKMLKYGTPDQRSHVLSSFYGKIVDLCRHNVACDVVQYAYNEYADALQRSRICSEFFGKEYQLFKVSEPISLNEILSKNPEKRSTIQKFLSECITSISTKPAMRHSLMHKICLEYFNNFSDENARMEIIDSLKERIADMLHTRDGALCCMQCVWFGSAKERKLMVKGLKGLVIKICQEEHGHQLLQAVFDSVDDTVTVAKVILHEVKKDLATVLNNKYGARVILYLLNPRDPKHFDKQQISLLSTGDSSSTNKKPADVKHQELLLDISGDLLAYAADKAREMIFDSPKFPFLFGYICQYTSGDKSVVYESICDILSDDFIPCNVEDMHLIEHSRGHYILSNLLKNDKILHAAGQKTLSEFIVDRISEDQLASWLCCNKGAFILINMVESNVETVREKVLQCVRKNKKKLLKYSFKGASVLLGKI